MERIRFKCERGLLPVILLYLSVLIREYQYTNAPQVLDLETITATQVLADQHVAVGESGISQLGDMMSGGRRAYCRREELDDASGKSLSTIDILTGLAKNEDSPIETMARGMPCTGGTTRALSTIVQTPSRAPSHFYQESKFRGAPGPTSVDEAVAAGYDSAPDFSLQEAPLCRFCSTPGVRERKPWGDPNGNPGRYFWKCGLIRPHRDSFICWDDSRGIRTTNPKCLCENPIPAPQEAYCFRSCDCGEALACLNPTGKWTCAKGQCHYLSNKLNGEEGQAAPGERFRPEIMLEDYESELPVRIKEYGC
ncbi:hypothetical protein CBER1_06352 [Cercospora berteroae]|uniref:GRF-like zinc ribbon domain-containing protein n=1 Tax=Cercospora berteroae TaxID=357750 RepID=A0A2S6C957_9PEZI|nr:hypothetical protein CBER1_06352 [Cercospora berteroae]